MRRSTVVQLTLLPMLAVAAVAAADPGPPGMTEPVLAPPGLKPTMDECQVDPAWKMILSNQAILPILWELFPLGNDSSALVYLDRFLGMYRARDVSLVARHTSPSRLHQRQRSARAWTR